MITSITYRAYFHFSTVQIVRNDFSVYCSNSISPRTIYPYIAYISVRCSSEVRSLVRVGTIAVISGRFGKGLFRKRMQIQLYLSRLPTHKARNENCKGECFLWYISKGRCMEQKQYSEFCNGRQCSIGNVLYWIRIFYLNITLS